MPTSSPSTRIGPSLSGGPGTSATVAESGFPGMTLIAFIMVPAHSAALVPWRRGARAQAPTGPSRLAARLVDVLGHVRLVHVLPGDGNERGADVLGHRLALDRVRRLLHAVLALQVGVLGDGELDRVRLQCLHLLRVGVEGRDLDHAGLARMLDAGGCPLRA